MTKQQQTDRLGRRLPGRSVSAFERERASQLAEARRKLIQEQERLTSLCVKFADDAKEADEVELSKLLGVARTTLRGWKRIAQGLDPEWNKNRR